MGANYTTTWTCDRCEATEHFDGQGQHRPHDWASLVLATPPRKNRSDAEALGSICSDCVIELTEWFAMRTPPPTDKAAG